MLKIYSIRDSKGESYGTPIYKSMHGEAERDFQTLVNDPKSTPHLYPEDFDLYHLGEFDPKSGTIKGLDTPCHILKAISVKKITQ